MSHSQNSPHSLLETRLLPGPLSAAPVSFLIPNPGAPDAPPPTSRFPHVFLHGPDLMSHMPPPSRDGDVHRLHVAFDWDSTVADSSSDTVFRQRGRPAFAEREWELRDVPMEMGPMGPLFMFLLSHHMTTVSIVTARTGREIHRVSATLASWGAEPFSVVFSGNSPKGPVARAIGASILFDDIPRNIESAVSSGLSGCLVPGPGVAE